MNPHNFHWFFLNRAASILVLLVSGFLSCEKDPEPIVTNSCIRGFAYIEGSTSGEVPQMKIIAKGPYGTMTTNTDSEGSFWFRNVGNGTYDMECSRAGYGTVKRYGIQVFGSDTVNIGFSLNRLPDKNLRLPGLLEANPGDQGTLIIKTNGTACEDYDTGVRFYIGYDSDVSNTNFEFTTPAYLYSCEYRISYNYLGLESGTEIYLVGYIYNRYDSGYLDMYNNRVIYPTVNLESKSEVLHFILP